MQGLKNIPLTRSGLCQGRERDEPAAFVCSRLGSALLAGVFHKAVCMQRRFLLSAFLCGASLSSAVFFQAPTPLRVISHSSFDLPKPLLASF
jgi:hypothetical protein